MTEPVLSPSLVKELLNKGLNQTEIAIATGKTKQAVSRVVRLHNLREPTAREVVLEHYPWETGGPEFRDSTIDRRMRDHAEFYATDGEGMPEWKLTRLRAFYTYLREHDFVVEFDPALPSIREDESYEGGHWGDAIGGFAFRPREEADDDLIIRVNEHTRLTDEGRMIWRYPAKLP